MLIAITACEFLFTPIRKQSYADLVRVKTQKMLLFWHFMITFNILETVLISYIIINFGQELTSAFEEYW